MVLQSLKTHDMKRISLLLAVLVLAGCASAPKAPVPDGPATTIMAPPPAVVVPKTPPRIGLALGGGAARGFAHVGVIQVLEEAGIRPVLVSGTSAGSLVAAIYASGKNGKQLQQVAETMEEATFADWTLPLFNRGMLRGDALAKYVNTQVGSRLIEDLPMPLGIVATDLNSGQSMLFQRGDTGTAVRASSSVPAVFQPVRISGRDYVDGGLVSPVPVRAARQMGAELVIAVDISSAPENQPGRRHAGRAAANLLHHEQEHQLLRVEGSRRGGAPRAGRYFQRRLWGAQALHRGWPPSHAAVDAAVACCYRCQVALNDLDGALGPFEAFALKGAVVPCRGFLPDGMGLLARYRP